MTCSLMIGELNIKLFIQQRSESGEEMPLLPEITEISDKYLTFKGPISEHCFKSLCTIYIYLKHNKAWKEHQFNNFHLDNSSPSIILNLSDISRSLFKKDLYLSAKKS